MAHGFLCKCWVITGGRHVFPSKDTWKHEGEILTARIWCARTGTIKVEALSEVCPESASILLVSVCRRHLETQSIQLQPGVLTGLKAEGEFLSPTSLVL